MIGSNISKIGEGIAKITHSAGAFISMACLVVTWYMIGPFLNSETWQLLRYRLKRAKDKFQEPRPDENTAKNKTTL